MPAPVSPAFRVTLPNGQDITPTLNPRLVSLTLTEARNNEADQLDLVLDDSDGKLKLPSKGQTLSLSIGWAGQTLVGKGSFEVTEITHTGSSGQADQLHINAKSADLGSTLRNRADRSYHATALGAIVQQIAARHSLSPRIDAALSAKPVAHIDQTGESDLAFLTRLAKRYDAVATIKQGRLLFLPIQGTKTSQGDSLPTLAIARADGDGHRYHTSDRDHYTGVRAYWHNPGHAKRKGVLVGKKGSTKNLPDTYANQEDARAAAVAEWRRLQRGAATLELTLALGRPTLCPQTPVTVSGYKPEICATRWQATHTTHTISDGGYTTRVELENADADTAEGGTVADVETTEEQ